MPNQKDFDLFTKEGRSDYRAALALEYPELAPSTSQKRIAELEAAIRNHRDQRGDDRCWIDDQELYQVLGDVKANTALPTKEVFMENCARFHATRQAPGDQLIELQQGRWCSAEELKKFSQVSHPEDQNVDQSKIDMDRFVSRYGVKVALNCLINGLSSLQKALEELDITDTQYITNVVKDLHRAAENYKASYNEE